MATRLALGAVLATLTSCAPAPGREGAVRIGIPDALAGLDPHRHADHVSAAVLGNAYEALVEVGRDLRQEPGLAEHWESPDAHTWRFRLREGVRFHTGEPLTAADVVASLERARTMDEGGAGFYMTGIRSVRALGPQLVEITTEEPDAALLGRLASLAVLPARLPADLSRSVGTGPFVLERAGTAIELRAFPDYWGEPPGVEVARIEPMAMPEEGRRELGRLGLDVVTELTPREVRELQGMPGYRFVAQPTPSVMYLHLGTQAGAFADPRVRRAVHLTLDREALVEEMLLGYGRKVSDFVTPEIFGYSPERLAVQPEPEEARRLLQEAGHPEGLAVELEVRQGRPVRGLVEQLARGGIHATLVARPWPELPPRLADGAISFYYGGFISVTGDAAAVLEATVYTRGVRPGLGELNLGYSNPEVDALIDAARRAESPRARRAALQECLDLLAEDLPLIPVVSPDDLYAISDRVSWRPRLDGRLLVEEMSLAGDEAAP